MTVFVHDQSGQYSHYNIEEKPMERQLMTLLNKKYMDGVVHAIPCN
jgi:hypothetical protein